MRIGFRTAGFREWELRRALEMLKEIGYDGVEVCLENHDLRPDVLREERVAEVRGWLDHLELELASVSFHADGAPLDTRVPNTSLAVGITRALGGDILIINTERPEGDKRREQWRALVGRMAKLCEVAEREDVYLAVEPEPGLLVHGMEDMASLRDEVDSERLKINLDIGHCHITDDAPSAVRQFASDIVHTHFEDIRDKVHAHLVPGQGDVDLVKVVRALREVGYGGYLTVDLFAIVEDPVGYARRSLEAMRRIADEALP